MKNLTKGIAAVGALAMLTGVGACGSNTADDKGQVYFLNNKPEVVNQWNELAEMYTKQTGVKVDIQSATSGSYESTLSSELAKNNAPTMFGSGHGRHDGLLGGSDCADHHILPVLPEVHHQGRDGRRGQRLINFIA